jgi:hypothetical protein
MSGCVPQARDLHLTSKKRKGVADPKVLDLSYTYALADKMGFMVCILKAKIYVFFWLLKQRKVV